MLTNYQKMLVDDLSGPDSYGRPLVGWKRQTEFLRNVGAPIKPGALDLDLAGTFVEEVAVRRFLGPAPPHEQPPGRATITLDVSAFRRIGARWSFSTPIPCASHAKTKISLPEISTT